MDKVLEDGIHLKFKVWYFFTEKVFDESLSTQDIFDEIGVKNINLCFEGKNGKTDIYKLWLIFQFLVCFFAYG